MVRDQGSHCVTQGCVLRVLVCVCVCVLVFFWRLGTCLTAVYCAGVGLVGHIGYCDMFPIFLWTPPPPPPLNVKPAQTDKQIECKNAANLKSSEFV